MKGSIRRIGNQRVDLCLTSGKTLIKQLIHDDRLTKHQRRNKNNKRVNRAYW